MSLELAPGQNIAGYEIVRHVTSGGMASLYLGRRRGAAGFQKLVAIKVVHPHLAKEPRFIGMFLDEARLVARIQHPNVVHVEELREEAGTYLMVMEYVHGCALYDLLKRLARRGRSINPALAAWIGARAAEGLHAAHELSEPGGRSLNVVHRDVSPQNVLLSFDGHVKLIDFGVAKSTQQQQQTRAGVLRGKIGYMSPEQANGLVLDRRTDVYALGIVLWEMLTCRRLFHSPNEVQQLDMVRAPRIVPPSTHVDIPPALDEVVMDALRVDPSLRIPTAKALRDRLLRAVPEAATLASEDLAGLLATVMGPEIRAAELPSAAEIEIPEIRPDEGFVQQHTQAAAGARYATEELDLADIDVLADSRGSGNFDGAPGTGSGNLLEGGIGRPRLGQASGELLMATEVTPVSAGALQAPAPQLPGALTPAPMPTRPSAPPSAGSGAGAAVATSISLLIAALALGAAGYLAWSEGWLDFLEAPTPVAVDAGPPGDGGAETNEADASVEGSAPSPAPEEPE